MKKFFLAGILMIVDQVFKFLAMKDLLPTSGGVFRYVCNPFLSWGIFLPEALFWILWLLAFGALLVLLKRTSYDIFLLIAFSGAFSNFIDRTLYGCVIDYIKIGSFPIFNLADTCITLGIFLFIINYFKNPSEKL
jgi:signal peptidase II